MEEDKSDGSMGKPSINGPGGQQPAGSEQPVQAGMGQARSGNGENGGATEAAEGDTGHKKPPGGKRKRRVSKRRSQSRRKASKGKKAKKGGKKCSSKKRRH